MPDARSELFAALAGNNKPKRRATGDPGGWKLCTDACIRVEAKLAQGCICHWGCMKANRTAKTKHVRLALDWRCLIHSAAARK